MTAVLIIGSLLCAICAYTARTHDRLAMWGLSIMAPILLGMAIANAVAP